MNITDPFKLIGLDPGLRRTGWGIIQVVGTRLTHVANGEVGSDPTASLAERLCQIHDQLADVIALWRPHQAAVEEVFLNRNAGSSLKLGQARGVVLLAPARAGLPVAEFSPNQVKKAVVGNGHAAKQQIHAMIKQLLPTAEIAGPDAADALAVAVCCAHFGQTLDRWRQFETAGSKSAQFGDPR